MLKSLIIYLGTTKNIDIWERTEAGEKGIAAQIRKVRLTGPQSLGTHSNGNKVVSWNSKSRAWLYYPALRPSISLSKVLAWDMDL